MRRFYLVFMASLVALSACNGARKPSDKTFTKAINEYLAKHGEACTVIGRQFPIDIPRLEQNQQYGIGPKLMALEQSWPSPWGRDDGGGPQDARSPARFNSAATCEAIRTVSGGQEVFSADSRSTRTNQRLLLWAEECQLRRQVDRAGDNRNILSNWGYVHLQNRGRGKLGATSGSATGVFGYSDNRQRRI